MEHPVLLRKIELRYHALQPVATLCRLGGRCKRGGALCGTAYGLDLRGGTIFEEGYQFVRGL